MVRNAEDNDERKPSFLNILLSLIIICWQSTVVERYSLYWPGSLWSGHANVLLNQSCERIYFVMHWTLFWTYVSLFCEFLLLMVAFVPLIGLCCLPCMCCCVLGDMLGYLGKFGFAVWGFWVVLTVRSAETPGCQDLYSCAWWSYLGIFLLSIVFVALSCCIVRSTQSSDAPKQSPTEDDHKPSIEEGAGAVPGAIQDGLQQDGQGQPAASAPPPSPPTNEVAAETTPLIPAASAAPADASTNGVESGHYGSAV